MENIIRYLKDLSEVWYEIGFNLKIPTTKLDDIEDEIESDEEGLTTMLKEWLQRKGQRTWREIIWAICKMLDSVNDDEDIGSEGDSELEDDAESEEDVESEDYIEEIATICERMLHLAEPINGMQLTCKVRYMHNQRRLCTRHDSFMRALG